MPKSTLSRLGKLKKSKEIYLDYAAATPLNDKVSLLMQKVY